MEAIVELSWSRMWQQQQKDIDIWRHNITQF
jgi:hypothetical protein